MLVFFAALVCADDVLYNDAYTELLAAVKRTRGADAGGDVVTVGSNAAALLARARFTVSGEDLSGIRVENCDLRGCQFVETKLTGASLSNAWVEHTEFYCCAMKDVDMSGCSLGTALLPLFFQPGEQCPNVHAVTVTPDGCHIVAGGGDGTICLFDTTTGERGFSFKAHSAACGAVVVTPDASRIVTCSADKTVRVWDVQTGQQLCVLGEDIPNTRALAVTPDGSRVVCCSGKSVHVWALWTGKEVLVHDNEAFGSAAVVCLTPNGSRILSCSGRVLQVWDLEKVEVMRRFEGHAMDVLSLAVTPDGKVVSGSQDETARLWNVSTGEVVRVFRSCFPINAVAVTPDGCHLVAGCGAKLYVWEVSTGEEVRVLNADGAICAVAVSPDGRRVVSASSLECFISVWDVQPEKPDLRAETHTGTVHAVVVTPKGHIISCAADLMMRVWDTSTGLQIQTLALKRQTVGQIPAVSPDGNTALFCILGSVFAWDISSGEWFGLQVSTGENEAEPGEYSCVAVSRDKGCGVIGFRTGYVQLLKYSSENGIELTRKFLVHTKGSVNDIAVMPDGDHVVSCSDDKTARIWDIRTGKVTMVFAHDDAVKHVAVIPDGSRLVACTAHHVHVWDVACGTTVYKPFQVHELRGVAVSPCGRRMVVCAAVKECAVRVYDIATGDVVASTVDNCPYLRVHSVAVIPDGNVVGGCSDGTVRVWRIRGNVLHPTRTMGLPRAPPRALGPDVAGVLNTVTPKSASLTLLNSAGDTKTLLRGAAREGDLKAVQLLLLNGAGNVRDKHGNLPLWYALQHKDADVRGRLEEALSAHAAEILDEVEADVERYLTTGVGTAGVAEGRGDAHPSGSRTTTSTADRVGKDDVDRDTDTLQCTEGREGRKVEWLQKEDSAGGGGEDLLCWLRGLSTVDPPLGYADKHVQHLEAGFRVVCESLLEDIGKRREAAVTRGYVEVEDWMAARDPFELLLSWFLYTSEYYILLTDRAILDHHGSAAVAQWLALYTTMNTAMRAVGQLPEVKEWKGEAALNVFELSPAPRQLHVIATFAPLIRGLQRLIGSRRKQLRTVFRGIDVNVSAKYTLGTRVVWNCFTSTTPHRKVAKTFMSRKGGTFFVVVPKEGAADVRFSSSNPDDDGLLYTANTEFRVQWKLSPTLLRMMGLRFDVIVMQEVREGVGAGLGVGVEKTSAAEQVGVLQEVMEHTVVFFADYLAQYVEGRVGDATCVEESETRPLMKEVRVWLRARAGRKRRALRKQMAVAAAVGTDLNTTKETKCRKRKAGRCDMWCLVGEGGSGKTSASMAILSGLVQSVTNTYSEWRDTDVYAKPYFPVFVALPTVKKHLLEEGGLDRFVLESFALKEADRAFLADRYEVVLVLDSLDEVGLTQEEVRTLVAEKGLVCRHPWVRAHCSVLVTVRGEYLDSVDVSPSDVCGSGVRAVYMQPFTEKDARVYITRVNEAWAIKLKEQKKKEKETKDPTSDKPERTVWVREEDVEGLVRLRDPFVLHIACHAQCSGDASEVMIFEQYLNTWTKEMVSCGRDSCDEDVLAREVEAVLRAGELVACRMLATNEWQGTVSVMSQYLEQQHDMTRQETESGFRCLPFRIEDFGEERSTFTFCHKSLGEYLAARRLARDPTSTLELLGQCSFSKEYQSVTEFSKKIEQCGVATAQACREV